MQAKKKLKQSQNGVKSLLDKHGERVVYVRHHNDEESQPRHKTINV